MEKGGKMEVAVTQKYICKFLHVVEAGCILTDPHIFVILF